MVNLKKLINVDHYRMDYCYCYCYCYCYRDLGWNKKWDLGWNKKWGKVDFLLGFWGSFKWCVKLFAKLPNKEFLKSSTCFSKFSARAKTLEIWNPKSEIWNPKIWKSQNLEIRKSEKLKIWKSEILKIWKSENLKICKSENVWLWKFDFNFDFNFSSWKMLEKTLEKYGKFNGFQNVIIWTTNCPLFNFFENTLF